MALRSSASSLRVMSGSRLVATPLKTWSASLVERMRTPTKVGRCIGDGDGIPAGGKKGEVWGLLAPATAYICGTGIGRVNSI